MEGAALIFIGAVLFSQSWNLLELYPDGRTMGIYAAGFGLAVLMTLTFTPMVLIGLDVDGLVARDANTLAETTIMKGLIILWAGYGIGIGLQGLFDLDDRAIGFYSGFLAIATLVSFLYYVVELESSYGPDVWLALSGASLILSVLAGTIFFYLAVPFSGLRQVAAWFILVGSITVSAIGLALVTTAIEIAAST